MYVYLLGGAIYTSAANGERQFPRFAREDKPGRCLGISRETFRGR